jgi:hypothetical protein
MTLATASSASPWKSDARAEVQSNDAPSAAPQRASDLRADARGVIGSSRPGAGAQCAFRTSIVVESMIRRVQ